MPWNKLEQVAGLLRATQQQTLAFKSTNSRATWLEFDSQLDRLIYYVALDKLFSLSVPQFLTCKMGSVIRMNHKEVVRWLDDLASHFHKWQPFLLLCVNMFINPIPQLSPIWVPPWWRDSMVSFDLGTQDRSVCTNFLDLLTLRLKTVVCRARDSARREMVAGSAVWFFGSHQAHSCCHCELQVRAGWARMSPAGFSTPHVACPQPVSPRVVPTVAGRFSVEEKKLKASWGLGSEQA